MDSERATHLRRLLVATAEVAPAVRPRPTRRVLAAGLSAFVLAGALTGGAAATAISGASPDSRQWVLENSAKLSMNGGGMIGESYYVEGSGDLHLSVPAAPKGASQLMVAFDCRTGGQVELSVDSRRLSQSDCNGVSTSRVPGGPSTGHTITLTAGARKATGIWAVWTTSPARPEMSGEQQVAIDDGVVTREEYLAGYDRYAGCMSEAGYPIGDIPKTTTILSFAISGDAVASGADDRCYYREFRNVDMLWQIANEQH